MNGDKVRHRVFVSYRREDTSQVVARLVEHLTGLLDPDCIFWDQESLHGGQDWQAALRQEVERSSIVLVMIGAKWLLAHNPESGRRRLDEADDWVRCELEWALAKKTGTIIPILVDGAVAPQERYLPNTIAALVKRQANRLRTTNNRDWQSDLGQLLIDAGLRAAEPQRAPAPARESADEYLLFRVQQGTVTCVARGEDAITEAFVAPEPGTQPERDLARINDNTCVADDIRNLGRELWQRLRPGGIEALVNRVLARAREDRRGVVEVRLSVERDLEGLPWEAIDDDNEDCLSITATRSVSRLPLADSSKANVRSELGDGKLRLIVVIPGGSGLQSSSEWQKIRETLGDVQTPVEVRLLDGQVTPDLLADAMRSQKWDIVHFIGHGQHDREERQFKLRLNGGKGLDPAAPPSSDLWMPASTFVQTILRAEPQIVVLNCCDSAGMDGFGSSIGSLFLKRGVPAAVVMRYEIRDDAAALFSRRFYRELLAGPGAGDVGLAVQEGRAELHRNFSDRQRVRSHITPVLYLASGCRKLLAGVQARQLPKPPRVELGSPSVAELPETLLEAMRRRCCLPILGPGILAADAVRRGESGPLDPHALGRRIAQGSAFPDLDRLHPLAETSAQWLVPLLFQRYCQHFEMMQNPGLLSSTVQQAYSGVQPPAAVELIASWDVPGFAYTHLDGLLETALINRGRKPCLLRPPDLIAGMKPAPGGLPLLTLRGHFSSVNSMMLTEYDEDLLVDAADRIAACLEDLMRLNSSTSLLFLGVSPRDPIVRALARRLLRPETWRSRGIAYFVAPAVTPADRGYWKRFVSLEWLEVPTDTAIRGLTAASVATREQGAP